MSYDFTPMNRKMDEWESVNQSAWPKIWRWLCAQHGGLDPAFIRGGQMNDGLLVPKAVCLRFAEILSANEGGPAELEEDNRRFRLKRFFEECGGFRIH